MSYTDPTQQDRSEPTIRELIAQITLDISKLISTQIELVKAELSAAAQSAASVFGLIAAALLIFGIAVFFFFFAVAFGLNHLGLPMWASFAIVTLFLILLGALLLFVGIRRAKKIKGPERSAAQMEMTKQAFEDAATNALIK